MACAGMMLVVGCNGDLKDRIDDVEKRVTSLETLTKSLDDLLKSGELLTSATPLPGNAGWTLVFSRGTTITVENTGAPGAPGAPGANGITPKLEVRNNSDGTVTIWYNVTSGYPDSGWVNTEVDLGVAVGDKGDKGDKGDPGQDGQDGRDGQDGAIANLSFKVDENPDEDNTLYLYFSTDNGTTWEALIPISETCLIAAISDNGDGTVTFVINDGSDTTYTFAKAATDITRIEVVKTVIIQGATESDDVVQVTFRVNPSNATVPTSGWELDLVDEYQYYLERSRAGYVTPVGDLFDFDGTVTADGDKKGQYIASITIGNADLNNADYTLALVLNINDILYTSNVFVVNNNLPIVAYVPVDGVSILDEDAEEISTLTLTVGDEVTLSAVIAPENATDKSVAWSVDDDTVVTVIDGVVTAVAEGTAIVTVTAADGQTASVVVTVNPPAVYVESIAIGVKGEDDVVTEIEDDLELIVGDVATLAPIFTPATPDNEDVEWTISDVAPADCITMDADGVITANAEGTATITVTSTATADGEPVTAEVTVKVSRIPVTGVEILSDLLLHPGQTAELVATVKPDNATYKGVTWSVTAAPAGCVTVDNDGVVTAKATGTATITATSVDGDGSIVSNECAVTVTIAGMGIGQGDLEELLLPDYQLRFGELDEETGGQAWNDPAGGTGQIVYNATNVAPFPAGGEIPDVEAALEAKYTGADFVVTYEKLGQFGWRQKKAEDQMNYYGSDATDHLAILEGRIIKTDGITTNNQNNYGDRLVIRITVKLADSDASGLQLPLPDEVIVGYICVRLP
jgi:uncharacterized protein YjdB